MNNSTAEKKSSAAGIVVITLAGCLISMLNNGIRINYGLLSTAIERYTGMAAARVSFSIAVAQLFYGFALCKNSEFCYNKFV